ncbi:MAG: hypothetical protein J6Y43_02035 [Clostridia bacterium]|nr:hypothetical protein [Clostridia bacterium]
MDLKNGFLIGGWQAPPPTVANYRTLIKCGINTIFLNGDYTATESLVRKGVIAAEKTGVYVILEGGNNLNSPVIFRNRFKKFNCVIGVNVYDEPQFSQLEEVGKISGRVKKAYGDKVFFLNLLPSYSPPPTINGNFALYVEEYAKIISKTDKGGWLSFDYYPLIRTEDDKLKLGTSWLSDVETLSYIAKKYDLKPHFFVQSMAFGGTISRLHDRQPTVEDLRLQIYVYLSYGAKGFTHFCYQSPVSPEFNSEQTGLILNGGKTDRWRSAQRVNGEVSAFLSEYSGMRWQGCVKVRGENGDKSAFDGLDGFDFSNCAFIKTVKTDANLLVGVFKGENGKEGFVFTNFADTSENITARVSVCFNGKTLLTVYKKGVKKTKTVVKNASFSLGKGEGVFISAEKA